MVVDTSAIVAVVFREPTSVFILEALSAAQTRVISTVSILECAIVVQRKLGAEGSAIVVDTLNRLGLVPVAFDEHQAGLAQHAYSRFGKGMGHPAQLNFGDCATYALAADRGQPVLALGDDFVATDLSVVKLGVRD